MGVPDVTQGHVDLIQGIARNLARTGVGTLAGPDELESQALVTLWDLALAWDETTRVPFQAYLARNGRRRLIDWLRAEYGRRPRNSDGWGTRLSHAFLTNSLDDSDDLREPQPGPEDAVIARETLTETITTINQVCTPRERAVLLAPLTDNDDTRICNTWGMTQATAHTHRYQARRKLRKHLTHQ